MFDVSNVCGFPYANKRYFESSGKVVNVTGSVTQIRD